MIDTLPDRLLGLAAAPSGGTSLEALPNTSFLVRDFLNHAGYHTTAHVFAEVKVLTHEPGTGRHREDGEPWSAVEGTFTIADCNRSVTLDFDCHDAEDVGNALHKARLLRQVVGDFTAALEAAIARAGLLDD